MDKFCGECGAQVDTVTGLCPNCNGKKIADIHNKNQVTAATEKLIVIEDKPKKKRSKASTTIITVVLSICLFLTSFLSMVIYDVRNVAKEDNVEKLLDNVEIVDLLDEYNGISYKDLAEFYGMLRERYGLEATSAKLDSFIDRSDMKKIVAEKVAGFCEDLFDGKGRAKIVITSSEALTFLTGNSDIIYDEFGTYLNNYKIAEIVDWIFGGEDKITISEKDIDSDLLLVLKYSLSYVTMAIFIVLSAVIIFFMIRNNLLQGLCAIGIDFVVLGALTSGFALLAAVMAPIWRSNQANIYMMVGNFMKINVLLSVILLVVGVALIVIRALIKRHRTKIN